MKYHIDGKRLPEWAKSKIKAAAVGHPVPALARFYCNLAYTFIENGYVGGGRIEIRKTRYGIRVYLAHKNKPTKLSGGLCNGYIADLVASGLAAMDDDQVVLIVPEELVNKGQLASVAKAIRIITNYGWRNLEAETLTHHSISADDCVEAWFAIQNLLPAGKVLTKDEIRAELTKQLASCNAST
jgi:hypothetical protein